MDILGQDMPVPVISKQWFNAAQDDLDPGRPCPNPVEVLTGDHLVARMPSPYAASQLEQEGLVGRREMCQRNHLWASLYDARRMRAEAAVCLPP